jgi:hypothetical protein
MKLEEQDQPLAVLGGVIAVLLLGLLLAVNAEGLGFGDWLNSNANIITALATAVIAAFTFTLWRTSSGQLRQLQQSNLTALEAARTAQLSAQAAVIAAGAARDEVELARREFVVNHRAKLRVRLVRLGKTNIGQPVSILFRVVNVGDLEAKNIRADLHLVVADDKAAHWHEEFAVADSLVAGKSEVVQRLTTTPRKDDWGKRWAAEARIRIHGSISYTDESGIVRQTGIFRYSTEDLNRFRLPNDKDIERDYEYED